MPSNPADNFCAKEGQSMKINEASRATDLTQKGIQFYEAGGLKKSARISAFLNLRRAVFVGFVD